MGPGIDLNQLRLLVIRPALTQLGAWSQAAENLVTGTGLQESQYRFLHQIKGPALGFWQMEPATFKNLWRGYLRTHLSVARALTTLMVVPSLDPDPEEMTYNLRFAAAMCRLLYLSYPNDIGTTPLELATTYKTYYNTSLGAATIHDALPWFELACEGT
jgi:hypothetical protein